MSDRAAWRLSGWAVQTAAFVCLLAGQPLNRLTAQDTVPPGFGSLKRDEVVVRFATAQLEIQVLPLDEQVTRLLAPDTYLSLAGLVRSRDPDIQSAAARAGVDRPTLVMITFLGLVPQARFNPEDVSITSRGRLFRPVGIVPISPTWSSYQLEAREQAAAIYLFEPGISFTETMAVSYQGLASEAWNRTVRVLDQERTRVRARAQATQVSPGAQD
jgi:hypothetical protein